MDAAATGYTITAGGYTAEIAQIGAGLRGLYRDGSQITETWELGVKPPLSCGLILAPWPNRTEDGRYRWAGEDYQLDITEAKWNNANHGFVRRDPWELVDHRADQVTLRIPVGQHPGWPFDLVLDVTYSVSADGLRCALSALNRGPTPAPFALGFHTFLRVGNAPIDDCTLELGAQLTQPLTDRQLPAGPAIPVTADVDYRRPRALAGVQIDTPFTDTAHSYVVRDAMGTSTTLWTDREFPWVQAFIADPINDQEYPGRGRALAVEPMTSPPNALHTGVDVITLEPQVPWTGSWGIR